MTATEKMPAGVQALVEMTCGCADQNKLWPPVIAELERLAKVEYDEEADGWVPCIVAVSAMFRACEEDKLRAAENKGRKL